MATGSGRSLPRAPVGAPELLKDVCTDTVGCLRRLYREYGDIVTYPAGSDLTLFAFGPEHNHAVFGNTNAFYIVGPPGPKNSAQRRFGLGLFGLNGAKHQQHRRLLMPSVRKESVEAFRETVAQLIDEHLDTWRYGQTLDLFQEMKRLSLQVTGRLLFGLEEFDSAQAVARAFQAWVDDYSAVLFAQVLPAEPPGESYDRLLAAGDELEGHLRSIAQQRRETLADEHGDLLALLLRAQDAGHIGEADVHGELHTLVNAAYQTTACALTWMLFLLAQHPAVLDALGNELKDNQTARPGKLSRLDRVIMESLRILPPVVFTMRRSMEPVAFADGWLPAGAYVISSFFVSHRRPEAFPDPDRFEPDRWLGPPPSPYEYLPYGAGARMCMGATFAHQMFRAALTAIVPRYRLECVPGSRIDRNSTLTLGVRRGLPMTLLRPIGPAWANPVVGDIHELVDLPQTAPAIRAA